MQDKVQYLRIILTNSCNLSCYYCHKEGCDRSEDSILNTDEIIKLIKSFYKAGIYKFKFMGGEPTLRTDLPMILKGINGFIDGVDTSIITNGLFNTDFMDECFKAGLKRVNVSMHAWNDGELIAKVGLSKNKLDRIIQNIEYLHMAEKLSKLNYVVLKSRGYDELFDLVEWVNNKGLVLDVLNILYSEENYELSKEYCDFEEIIKVIHGEINVLREEPHENKWSIPSIRLVLDKGGVINLKTNQLNKFNPFSSCISCKQHSYCREGIKALRLTADGFIKPCLFREDNLLNVKELLHKNEEEIAEKLIEYIQKL